jgi:hypothetical protein
MGKIAICKTIHYEQSGENTKIIQIYLLEQ